MRVDFDALGMTPAATAARVESARGAIVGALTSGQEQRVEVEVELTKPPALVALRRTIAEVVATRARRS